MIKSIFLSLSCLNNKKILIILLQSIILTLLIISGIAATSYFGGDYLLSLWGWGMDFGTWSYVMGFLMGTLMIWFLFRTIAMLVLWMFADDIVDAIEWQHYSHAALTATKPSWIKSLMVGLQSLLRAIAYNLLALPLYFIALFTVIGTPIIFMIVNGYLLGRELEEMITLRHASSPLSSPEKWTLGKFERLALGFIMNAAMMIPFVNFFIPVIAASTATHMMHREDNGK